MLTVCGVSLILAAVSVMWVREGRVGAMPQAALT
jgi:hypothetical protein